MHVAKKRSHRLGLLVDLQCLMHDDWFQVHPLTRAPKTEAHDGGKGPMSEASVPQHEHPATPPKEPEFSTRRGAKCVMADRAEKQGPDAEVRRHDVEQPPAAQKKRRSQRRKAKSAQQCA